MKRGNDRPNLFSVFWRWCWRTYYKNEEVWNYLIVGALSTVLSIGIFIIFVSIINMHFVLANILSWTIGVIFSYCLNRLFVFHSIENKKTQEFIKFVASRVLSMGIDTFLMIVLVSLIMLDDVIAKLIVAIVIIILNYIMSKYVIFKKS